MEDQDHSANLLREGRVMAAVTADPQPVQGCQVLPLGTLRYRALASPAFMQRFFATGVTATTLARAPMLVFNRKDALQGRYVRRITRRALTPPVHWLPEAHAFVKATEAGLGWGMAPDLMVAGHLRSGTLVGADSWQARGCAAVLAILAAERAGPGPHDCRRAIPGAPRTRHPLTSSGAAAGYSMRCASPRKPPLWCAHRRA